MQSQNRLLKGLGVNMQFEAAQLKGETSALKSTNAIGGGQNL